jgi:hypothetical protein
MTRRIVPQLTGVVAALSVAALVFAQTGQSQTSPGTVPVPKPGVDGAHWLEGDGEVDGVRKVVNNLKVQG